MNCRADVEALVFRFTSYVATLKISKNILDQYDVNAETLAETADQTGKVFCLLVSLVVQ